MFNDTITLFNRYHSNNTGDTWYPHVLHNVEINTDKANIIATYGQESLDSALVIIHYENKTVEHYEMTQDESYDESKTYYVLNEDGDYVPTDDTVFQSDITYFEMSMIDIKAIDNLPFMPPKVWSKQTNDKLADSITFNDDAQLFDFFVVGELNFSEPILDDYYKKGFYNEMINKYDYCYAITNVGGPYKLIPHFELLAK